MYVNLDILKINTFIDRALNFLFIDIEYTVVFFGRMFEEIIIDHCALSLNKGQIL